MEDINKQMIEFIESIMHVKEINIHYFKKYTALSLNNLMTLDSL